MKLIGLLSDFSLSDPFVGIMKAVIHSLAANVSIVDITHSVPRHNIDYASFIIYRSSLFFPEGSVLIAVVDPGVGSDRNMIAVNADGKFFLAPDNGLLSQVCCFCKNVKAVSLTNRSLFMNKVSATFHGRDIFAPVAAHLVNGFEFEKLGEKAEPLIVPLKQVIQGAGFLQGSVLFSDSFGNLTTNIPASLLKNRNIKFIKAGNFIIDSVSSSYYDGRNNVISAVINSFDYLELAAYMGSAADILKKFAQLDIVVEFNL